MKKKLLYIAMVVLFLAACKSNSPVLNQVMMKGNNFSPNSLSVPAGTSVTWVNNDTTTHTVTSDNGFFDSGDILKGKSYKYLFPTGGTYTYHDTHDTGMTGTVIVTTTGGGYGY